MVVDLKCVLVRVLPFQLVHQIYLHPCSILLWQLKFSSLGILFVVPYLSLDLYDRFVFSYCHYQVCWDFNLSVTKVNICSFWQDECTWLEFCDFAHTSCVYSAGNYDLDSFFKRYNIKNFGHWYFNYTCIPNIYLGVRDQCSAIMESELGFLVLHPGVAGYREGAGRH